jgi:DNA-binding XRE family transcriptional regulator
MCFVFAKPLCHYTGILTRIMAKNGTATGSRRMCHLRNSKGISQFELPRRCGISRQALGAIEAGIYQPAVTVAIKLAHELGETVESLFGGSDVRECTLIKAHWTGSVSHAGENASGRVALARIGGKLVALPEPRPGYRLAPAMGMLQRSNGKQATVQSFHSPEEIDATLLVAGCDPSVAILIDWLTRNGSQIGVVALPYSSRKSLATPASSAAHAAGVHLRDTKGGEYNLEPVRRAVGSGINKKMAESGTKSQKSREYPIVICIQICAYGDSTAPKPPTFKTLLNSLRRCLKAQGA